MFDSDRAADSSSAEHQVNAAKLVLAHLGMPPAQQSTLSALTLLALLDLTPNQAWSEAENPLRGIHSIMRFSDQHYGTRWAENTRESFRKNAVHHVEAASLVVKNPDEPNRPTNSGKTVYQISDDALALIRAFGSEAFTERLPAYLQSAGALVDRYAGRRTLPKVPLRLHLGQKVTLSPGTHSDLIEQIIAEFGPRFTPDGVLIYAGDTGRKWDSYFDEATLEKLGVTIASTGTKMPDVVIYHETRGWLVVVEAFDSVGPIDPLRRAQLEDVFGASKAPRVYVTAFHSRRAMAGQAGKLAWETDIWIADEPDHLIHYNGERFLGPYE